MVKNDYLFAQIGVDTAQNGPRVELRSNELLIVLLILSPDDLTVAGKPKPDHAVLRQ